MKPKRKILSLLLVICLVVGLLPTTAFALDGDKTIMPGTSGISGYDSAAGYDYIYFGNWTAPDSHTTSGPIKWRVLDDQTNTGESGLFLLSDVLLGTSADGGVYFDNTEPYSNAWQGSDAQSWCKDFAGEDGAGSAVTDAFTADELGAILATTKSDKEFTSSTNQIPFAASENILNGDKVFSLSAEEAENSAYGFANDNARIANYGGSAVVWWLRSPYAILTYSAGAVYYNGIVSYNYYVDDDWAARPAFNLDLNSVLFTSAAEGGKIPAAGSGGTQGGEAADAIFEISDYSGNEWKLTLLDEAHKNFEISNATTNSSGNTIAFSYSGAQTGTNEYISVVIENNGAITHYGRILQLDGTTGSASGTASLTLPAGVTLDNDTKLYVFNEQYNGGEKDDTKRTDYGSKLIKVNPTVDNTAPALSDGTATRDSETSATVKFTSDEAGSYYYAVVESGATAPTINTAGTGTSCASGENTISLTSLSDAGAKDIYIVAKDAVGNVSQSLKISIPEYIAPSYSISATPSALDFGSMTEDYSSAPAAQTVTIQNTGNQTITLNQPAADDFNVGALSATELTAGGTATFTVQPKTGLAVGSHSETLTISGSDGASASVKLSFAVNAVYTLTVNLNGGSGSTTGGKYPEGEVVHIDAGSRSNYRFTGWTTSNDGSFADASSASTTFTMPAADTTITANWQYDPPYIPPSKPNWTSVARKLANAQPGDTVTVKMNGETEVPGDVWETIAGRDVTVVLDMGGNVSWTVDGNDVPTATHFADMDFGVDRNTTGIDADVINTVTGEVSSVQITLAHDGEFGFALTLTAPLGKENAGYWANLYHYDENAKTLNYETSAQVASDGTASLRMTHASQYAIVIDDKSHDLPFTDLGEGQWYESAVRYAYTHDIMEGMSATTFQPNGTLSRAMAVQIFYNLEGQPDISDENLGYPYEDVDAQAWYGNAVYWARLTGVATGYGDGTFQPTDSITRQEFAQMLYNYAKYKDYDLSAEGDLSTFPDGDSVQPWAETAMSWANGNQLINGHDNGTIDAGGTAIRAQAASILMRFDLNLVKAD